MLHGKHPEQWQIQGVAMVSAETPSERARAPNQRRLVSRRAKITLKYGYCVSLGAVLEGKLAAARKR